MSTSSTSTPVAANNGSLEAVKASFQILNRAKVRTELPDCGKMERFIANLTRVVPAWSASDQAGFKDLVSGQMPRFLFARFKADLRRVAGLPEEATRASSFEEAVRGIKALEAEVATLRATIAEIKASLARKRGKA